MRSIQKIFCFLLMTVLSCGVWAGCGRAAEEAADPAAERLNEFAARVTEESMEDAA